MRLEDIIIPQSYIYIEARGRKRSKAPVYAVEIKDGFVMCQFANSLAPVALDPRRLNKI